MANLIFLAKRIIFKTHLSQEFEEYDECRPEIAHRNVKQRKSVS